MKHILSILTLGAIFSIGSSGSAMTCSAISSCDKAYEYLRQGYTNLDRDGDGVPCESICKGSSSSSSKTNYITPTYTPETTTNTQSTTTSTNSTGSSTITGSSTTTGAISTGSASSGSIEGKIEALVEGYIQKNSNKTIAQHKVVVNMLYKLYLKQKTKPIKDLVGLYIAALCKRLEIKNPIK